MKAARWILGVVALVGVAFLIRITHSSVSSELDNFATWPSSPLIKAPSLAGIPGLAEVSFVRAGNQRVAGWFAAGHNGAVVILAHGTSADRTSLLAEARMLDAAGFGILAFDWPGYGESEGVIDWGQNESDALSGALDWLISEQHFAPSRIGGFGLSMGGYMMTQVAAQDDRIHAVVLAATPPDIIRQTRYEHRKWGILSQWPADYVLKNSGMPLNEASPVRQINRLSPRPVLVLGGDHDPIVSLEMVRELYDSALQPKYLLIVEGASHGNYAMVAPELYQRQLVSFFECGLLQHCPDPKSERIKTSGPEP